MDYSTRRLVAGAGAAAKTAATTAATTAAATGATLHGLGFVDGQVTAVDGLAVQRVDGSLAFLRVAHGDETEAAGALGLAIHDEMGFHDFAVLVEECGEVLFSGLEGKVSYVQFHTIYLFIKVATLAPN